MVSGGDTDTVVTEDTSTFHLGLDDLKRRGSALLVVGSVPTELYSRASKQMLGAPDEPRRRLLVLNDSTPLDARLSPSIQRSMEWTRAIRYTTLERGTAAVTSPVAGRVQTAYERHVSGGLGELGAEISEDVTEFDRLAGTLSPAELRVAFDCLPSLLSRYEREHVFRFLHIMTAHVRAQNGMVHVWSPGDRSDEINRVLEPLFDAVVELNVEGTEAQHRWHLRQKDVSSGWLPLKP
ncbi:hypothetical protein E6P09_09390 [Haloferax mediterranei ATCC 33500]|uniref:Uncharacterized protein n=1 Tax=Haloferax mediterranei (strain ATCC 33500 / DSM 1411 / JCM 8866 / NBRC 14739 / NCIMB 2177 / R-4) TaxID=523841 RepID=I3R430_HALMT|nr:hypothetical protein [Haloferax mediterranei]AFK18990.1 hypothetical protein HFX_1277 [Haloferax mediterranei ATCC 33500]AHZ21651.1 hypothetical protein BM92_02810 [Haloferax mediterranei ATCC 33500]EMA03152.1 hypothetical protein C439_04120 [Haloferax mediterranei ATCC 33500]MDX5989081.1 hypothetical protein [Haloferax mediterranei ATCC 33500]QCQ75470.1 hypothetical protein E6P09_09390 [Haloferax mediterranei ATCC 33500]